MRLQLKTGRDVGDEHVFLDGVEISRYVLRDSVHLDMTTPGLPCITLTLIPDVVEMDVEADVLAKLLEREAAQ